MINNRLEAIFEDLNAKVARNEIKSETEMMHKLFISLRAFYDSIGKPSFEYRESLATPVSSDYNDMIKEFVEDTNFIMQDCEKIVSSLNKAFTSIELDRETMRNQVRYILKKVATMKANPTIDNGAIVSESFTNTDIFDKAMCSLPPAEINTVEGVITLAKTASDNITTDMHVSINDKSTGFPGNSHIVAATGSAARFEGEDGLNNDPNSINDEQLDTWYEQELFKISSKVYDEVEGYGVSYKEKSMWITEDNKMMMGITLELDEARPANWLSLSPYIPEHRGASAATIKSIIVDDNKGKVQPVITEDTVFDDDIIIIFERQNFKYIRILIEQALSYNIDVGHMNYYEMNKQNRELFGASTGYMNRVEGKLPSVTALGMTYNPRTKALIHPSTKEPITKSTEAIKNALFDVQDISNDIIGVVEIMNANRFQIGIRNINVYSNDFEEQGEFISNAIEFTKPVKELTLDVNDIIPEGVVYDDEGNERKMIEYYISINDGEEWLPIEPINRAFNGKGQYLFNESMPADARKENIGYVDAKYDIYSVRVRAVMIRPTVMTTYTPIIKDFAVTVKFGGDGSEY